ncbi:LysR family transcriptional regulator [Pseudooceanicola nanhaiensis]|uniref:LysR family transcriptional regulator n=1 Tax=Pseudooceanicola nanhaiensis TaxID=375761 RepID=UPI001CD31913|nr:LysR family transcriptional regulator [Pseudooceanicola nanhaiensis]MCA0922868.1 LysR family transcriptional regulator [Pseudooceanicola nanhaiensis]
MEIKELRCFTRVAETLNFNRAAEMLNMSQPVVTKTIAQLEHKLGVKLFERTTRRVSLTPAGVVLRREADGLLAYLDQVQRAVRHAIAEESGRFAIGVTPLAMQTVFPGVIRGFREAHPEIEVSIHELPTDAQVKDLLAASIDAAFLLMPAEDPALEVREIHSEQMRLAVPVSHPHLKALGNAPLPLSAFAGETFIIPARAQNPGVHDEIIRACAVSGFRPKVKDCTEGQSCLCLVEAGMGVSFVTNRIDCAASGDMRIVDLEDPAPSLSVALAWRKDDPSPLLDTLRDLALEGATA